MIKRNEASAERNGGAVALAMLPQGNFQNTSDRRSQRRIGLRTGSMLIGLAACSILSGCQVASMAPMPELPNDLMTADRLLKDRYGNIAYNVPATINIEDSANIQLLLDMNTPIGELQQQITAAGAKEGRQIFVTDEMTAVLTGADFQITKGSPDTQTVSSRMATEWSWRAKPLKTGRLALDLTVTPNVTIGGNSQPIGSRTFNREILVEVRPIQGIRLFVREYWQWLATAVFIPLVTWAVQRILAGVKTDRSK